MPHREILSPHFSLGLRKLGLYFKTSGLVFHSMAPEDGVGELFENSNSEYTPMQINSFWSLLCNNSVRTNYIWQHLGIILFNILIKR